MVYFIFVCLFIFKDINVLSVFMCFHKGFSIKLKVEHVKESVENQKTKEAKKQRIRGQLWGRGAARRKCFYD